MVQGSIRNCIYSGVACNVLKDIQPIDNKMGLYIELTYNEKQDSIHIQNYFIRNNDFVMRPRRNYYGKGSDHN